MAQGFTDFGKGLFDMFGTGGASVLDLIESAKTGNVTNRRQDDFRKWLYQTDSTKDAAAKGLGTALNGVQTVADYIPGVNALTQTTLGNAAQGALGGLADELKTYGEDYDLGRAGQRAAISAAGAAVSGGLADALKGSNNALLSSNTVRGLARGATGGAISGGGYAAIDGGDVLQAAKQGAGMGALIGGATGAFQDFAPRKSTYNAAMTDEQRQARIANIDDQLSKLDTSTPEGNARYNELMNARDNYLPTARALETTLADADMAVNNPRYLTDENGNPRTFYHGSPNKNITEFDINQAGKNTSSGEHALYFTDSPQVADDFSYERLPGDSMFIENKGAKGRVYPVNLEMNNPLDLDNLTDAQIRELWEYASPLGQLDGQEKFIRNLTDWRDNAHNAQLTKGYLDLDKLRNSQYDGFMARMYPNQDNQAREYAVFDNSKVKMLEDVLANDDMAVNSAKIAPGQLGLFDDMPTQTPKTGTRQTSLFDQPDNPYLDYYGADIDTAPLTPETPANPYAPVNGQVTQAMRDRAADVLGNWKKNGVPENELYNAIDPSTLPAGYEKAINVLDNTDTKKYLKDKIGTTDIKKAKFDRILDYLYGDNEAAKRTYTELRDQQIQSAKEKAKLLGLPEPSKSFVPSVEGKLREEVGYKIAKDIRKTLRDIPVDAETGEVMPLARANLDRLDPKVHSFRTGYTAAADEAFSERLGIAPGNTPKYNGRMDVRNAYGRYSHPIYGVGGDVAIFERKINNPEDAISSVAHERLHSFQNEATNKANNTGRYSKEVEDAFKDLRKDLEQHYKSWDETAKRYGGGRGNTYWNSIKEQEARMLETYLQNKGYTDAPEMKSKYRAGEWGNEINPAFDKFFDKLRDLSKRGVALPALAALFGGGAYMASQENDKEKEVK
jgi:hypothetical protein